MKKRSVSPWNLRKNDVSVHRGLKGIRTWIHICEQRLEKDASHLHAAVSSNQHSQEEPNHKTHCSVIRA